LNLAIAGNFFPRNTYGDFVPSRDVPTWNRPYTIDYVRVYDLDEVEYSEDLEQSDESESSLSKTKTTGNTDNPIQEQTGYEFMKWGLPSILGLVALVVIVVVLVRRRSREVTKELIPLTE